MRKEYTGLLTIAVLFLVLLPAPAQGLDPIVGFESVERGYLAVGGDARHPRNLRLIQLIESNAFAELESVLIGVLYERSYVEDGAGPFAAASASKVGKITARVFLHKQAGGRYKLGIVKGKVLAHEDELEALKLVNLAAAIEAGDWIEWLIKMKGFPVIPDDDVSIVNPAIAHPAMILDDD